MRAELLELVRLSENDVIKVGAQLSKKLRKGDCICLSGDIGAGKSVLCRSIIQSLQITPEEVPSPTFTIVQTYPCKEFEIWHCDLYRLGSSDQLFELGLDDALETEVCLIEWPDRLGPYAPKSSLWIDIEIDNGSRTLRFQASDTNNWKKRLENIK